MPDLAIKPNLIIPFNNLILLWKPASCTVSSLLTYIVPFSQVFTSSGLLIHLHIQSLLRRDDFIVSSGTYDLIPSLQLILSYSIDSVNTFSNFSVNSFGCGTYFICWLASIIFFSSESNSFMATIGYSKGHGWEEIS